MEIRSAVTLARDGLEEGNRVIASILNKILSVRCPELRIKCEEVLPGDSMQTASSKLKNAWHYLGTRVPRVNAIMPWTIGLLYPGPIIKDKDGRSIQDNVLWLIDVNGYLDQEMFDILERQTQWTLADWQAIVVSPFEEHHLQWERDVDSILDSLSLAEKQTDADKTIAEVLSQKNREILQAMRDLNATQDNPQSGEKILTRAGWVSGGKRSFDKLKEYKMVQSARGLGFFLTRKGLQKAKEISTRT